MKGVVGVETNGTSPQRDAIVNPNVGGALGREFGRRNSVHVCAPAVTVIEKENVGISLGSDREGAEAVSADGNARARRQGQRKYGPAHCLSRRLARLVLEAMSTPPSCAGVHADPPIKLLKHGRCAGVRATPRWHEALAWHACITHGYRNSGRYIRVGSSLRRRAARPPGVAGPAAAAGVDFRTSRKFPSSSLWRRPLSAEERVSERGGCLWDGK